MDGPHRVGIVGSRRRNTLYDLRLVFRLVDWLVDRWGRDGLVLVSGGCSKGADAFMEVAAKSYGVQMEIHPVEKEGVTSRWEFAKRAFARNRVVAERSEEIYCWVAPDRKGGTEDTISRALEFQRPVFLVNENGEIYLAEKDGAYPQCEPVACLAD